MKAIPFSLAALAAATAMTGCVVAPRPYYHAQPVPVVQPVPQPVYAQPAYAPGVVVVEAAPPAPYAEVIGVAPSPGYIWIGGAWFWEGGRHVWHRGYWAPPRAGHYWVGHHWEQVGHSWHFREGYWAPHRR